MSNNTKRDLPRQVATVVGAVFQVLAGAIVPIGAIAKETPSLVIPPITPSRSGPDLPPLPGLRRLPGTASQPTEPSAAACGLVLCRGVLPQRSVGGACSAAPARAAAGNPCRHLRVPGRCLPAPRAFEQGILSLGRSVVGRAAIGAALWLDHRQHRKPQRHPGRARLLGSGALSEHWWDFLIAGAALASAVISVGKAGPLQCLLATRGRCYGR